MVLSRCVTVLQKLPPPSLQKNMALNGSWRERDPREGRKEIGHEGLCILLSWTVKLVSTRPGTNQIEERYGEEEDFVERSSGEKLLDTLLATCTICSAATLDLSILYHPVFLATERSDEWKIKLSQHARCPGWVDSTRGKGTWVGATRFVKLINGGGRRGIGDEKQNRRWWELFFVRFLPTFHENKNVSPTLFKFSSQMNYFVEYTNCHWKKPWSTNKGSTS